MAYKVKHVQTETCTNWNMYKMKHVQNETCTKKLMTCENPKSETFLENKIRKHVWDPKWKTFSKINMTCYNPKQKTFLKMTFLSESHWSLTLKATKTSKNLHPQGFKRPASPWYMIWSSTNTKKTIICIKPIWLITK